ncbi:MAG TPA: hypothetical protein VGU22_10485, partial [Methylomirabilota bacterium]|nr:hypothetical protein [Methylomirabilota bacterium]
VGLAGQSLVGGTVEAAEDIVRRADDIVSRSSSAAQSGPRKPLARTPRLTPRGQEKLASA